jgi:hypothetical protein
MQNFAAICSQYLWQGWKKVVLPSNFRKTKLFGPFFLSNTASKTHPKCELRIPFMA